MASSRAKAENNSMDNLRELRRDFEQKINQIQADIAGGQKSDAEETLSSLKKEFDRRFSYMRNQVDESIEPGRTAIRERPMVSVSVAAATGFALGTLVGIMISRYNDDVEE